MLRYRYRDLFYNDSDFSLLLTCTQFSLLVEFNDAFNTIRLCKHAHSLVHALCTGQAYCSMCKVFLIECKKEREKVHYLYLMSMLVRTINLQKLNPAKSKLLDNKKKK